MSEFRRLFLRAVTSGTIAGLVWFGAQYFAVIPLIEKAETYEAVTHEHHAEGGRPEPGWQRNAFTAVSTLLAGIGFAAVFFGALRLAGQSLDMRTGALWGLAGFASVSLAPALGLPPQPPGVAVADVFDRQLWWAGTVAATAVGLYLLARSQPWPAKLCGMAVVALPHAIGAPAASGETIVPGQLIRQFTVASIAAAAIFWLALGFIGGFLSERVSNLATRRAAG